MPTRPYSLLRNFAPHLHVLLWLWLRLWLQLWTIKHIMVMVMVMVMGDLI
jgi:hypothetical protein